METFSDLYCSDVKRYKILKWGGYVRVWLYFFRKSQTTHNGLLKLFYRVLFDFHSGRRGIEISSNTSIGRGLYIGHAYNITINPKAKIGMNCNIHKGVLIGMTNRGEKTGAPHIGNQVWIGINTAIVGDITIGDDVMIAPNTYINCDVPSHSIVFGNPCIIKHRENATEGYINNIVM